MNWLRMGLVLLVVLGGAGLALAAPEGGAHPPPHDSGEGPFKGTVDVAIWTIVVFLGLFFILKAKAWGPIQESLAKREADAVLAASAAQKAREEAEVMRAQFQKEKEAAAREVVATIEESRRDATRVVEEMKKQAQDEIAAERERLKREVTVARDQALQEIWQKAATLATSVSGRILPRELNDTDQRRLIELALNELQTQSGEIQALLKSREL